MACSRIPVTVSHKKQSKEWAFGYSCRTTTRVFWQLLVGDFRANEKFVFKAVGIDREAWMREDRKKKRKKKHKNKRSKIKRFRIANKALAMELLVAAILTCIDSPNEVRCWCSVSKCGRPKSYAPSGREDIRVTHSGFTVLVEVSTKKDPDEGFFRKQLKQALEHSDSLLELGTSGVVYALVVNKCSVESNARMDGVYSRVLLRRMDAGRERNASAASGGSGGTPQPDVDREVRLIPLTSLDFYEVANALLEKDSQAGLRVLNEVWREALEAVYRQLRGRNVADGERWMAEALKQALRKNEPAKDRLPLKGVDA